MNEGKFDTLTEIPPVMDSVPEIHQAFCIADRANLSPEELANIERQEMFIHDQQGAIIKAVKDAVQEAKQEGRQEEKLAIARQLLDRLDDETIGQITGLSMEEVRNLRSESG